MAKVVIKTPDGKYVGGGRDARLVERVTRAYLYEDGESVDAQIAIVNTTEVCLYTCIVTCRDNSVTIRVAFK